MRIGEAERWMVAEGRASEVSGSRISVGHVDYNDSSGFPGIDFAGLMSEALLG